jgi:hypothetical protein
MKGGVASASAIFRQSTAADPRGAAHGWRFVPSPAHRAWQDLARRGSTQVRLGHGRANGPCTPDPPGVRPRSAGGQPQPEMAKVELSVPCR